MAWQWSEAAKRTRHGRWAQRRSLCRYVLLRCGVSLALRRSRSEREARRLRGTSGTKDGPEPEAAVPTAEESSREDRQPAIDVIGRHHCGRGD